MAVKKQEVDTLK